MTKQIHTNEASIVETQQNYFLPDLKGQLTEKNLIGNLRLIDQALFGCDGIKDYDEDVVYSARRLLWEVQEHLELFAEYRSVVEKHLLQTHNKLQKIGATGGAVISLLESMDHDGLIAEKFIRDLVEINKKREAAKEVGTV